MPSKVIKPANHYLYKWVTGGATGHVIPFTRALKGIYALELAHLVVTADDTCVVALDYNEKDAMTGLYTDARLIANGHEYNLLADTPLPILDEDVVILQDVGVYCNASTTLRFNFGGNIRKMTEGELAYVYAKEVNDVLTSLNPAVLKEWHGDETP